MGTSPPIKKLYPLSTMAWIKNSKVCENFLNFWITYALFGLPITNSREGWGIPAVFEVIS